jgi:hypothetical protein
VTSPNADRRFLQFEIVVAVLSAAALMFAVAEWRGWTGDGKPFRPLQSILLASYFALISASWVARRRSERLADALGLGAIVAFVFFVARMMAG